MNLEEIIKEVQFKSNKTHPIIFISGLGGAGKTSIAKKIVAGMPNAKCFELDWYLVHSSKDRAKLIKDVLGPGNKNQHLIDKVLDPINWYDWESFKKDLHKFQEEGKFYINGAWDQVTGERDKEHILDFEGEKGIIICEGIFLLHPDVSSLADFSILMDLHPVEARKRREERDKNKYSKDAQEHFERKRIIMENYDIPYFNKYRKNADLIL